MPHFNSRPSARGDVDVTSGDMPGSVVFQFTPLREGRPTPTSSRWKRRKNFNSRPSARGDSFVVVLTIFNPISIHAPPRGATKSEVRT